MQAALLALWLTPLESSTLAARMGQLIVGMLIVLGLVQQDKGLGDLSYLTWIDYFSVLQFAILLISCIETVAVHHLWRERREDWALGIDEVMRWVIPLWVAGARTPWTF